MKLQRAGRNTLSDALQRSVRRSPNKTALIFDDRSWSYAKLDAAVQRVAARLLDMGLQQGDRLAAYGRNSDIYLQTFLACVRIGVIHVPINYALVEDELSYILNQCGARAVFSDPALTGHVDAVKDSCQATIFGRFRGADENDLLQAAVSGEEAYPSLPVVDLKESDCVQLMYTSGTTSRPKGAIMTHECLWAEYQSCIVEMDFKSSDVCLAGLPLYHTAQMHAFMIPSLLTGATTILIEAPDPALCFSLIEQHRVTSFFAPPTVWIGFLRHVGFEQHNLSSIQKLYYGASIMPEPIVQELMERLPNAGLYNCYGQTEISPVATVLRPEDHALRPASAGRPVLNVETRVVDDNMHDVAPGEQGEIVHRSPQLMRGYWEKPEETEEAFDGGWFHSGDLGVMDEEGYLFIVDRVKDVINTGGVLVASREVEEALYLDASVAEVAVIGLPDDKWIEAVTAVVVLKEGCCVDREALMACAREQLAPFKVPKRIHFADSLPKNASGKVLKRELRDRLW